MNYYRYWGKIIDDGSYHLLPYHCLDVAAVGNALLDAKPTLLTDISQKLTLPPIQCRSWLLFFLAFHDIGKFSTSFQNLNPILFKQLQQRESNKQYTTRHDSLGYFCWDKCLRKKLSKRFLPEDQSKKRRQLESWLSLWAKWSTGHHGMPPKEDCRELLTDFTSVDLGAVESFVSQLISLYNLEIRCDELCDSSAKVHIKQLSWYMAGLVTLCDWIGSNVEYFPPVSKVAPLEEYWASTRKRAEKAVRAVGIIPAIVAPSNSFHSLFPEYAASATPLQAYCNQVQIPQEPQLWILEDVTGAGKTEAALTLVARMMAKGLGQGCFVALPTMATSNAMYDRMGEVYSKLFLAGEQPSLLLAHGSRHLSEKFRNSFLEINADDLADNGEKGLSVSAQCSRWLADSSKKALLADVGVGTIDQVLLGILPARHQSLRLFGLNKKVLIVDEVHSYDPYMNRLLETTLEFHASTGGSVILLSATLPQAMRESLCNAYQKGLGAETELSLQNQEYPLVTKLSAQSGITEQKVETRASVKRSVTVTTIDEIDDVYDLIKQEVAKGRCICWIRNTVHDVRCSYAALLEGEICTNEEIMMFHSRFALRDRLAIEGRVLAKFGPRSSSDDRCGQILIASQVVEQSLDLDFDVMISDLAPIDLLIQRAGRLQRHERKELRDTPTLYLYGPTPDLEPDKDWYKNIFPKACYVYPDTANMWRTQQLLIKKGCISMPDGARALIEGVYGEEILITPDELLFSEEDYWATKMSDRSMASFNGLSMQKGYARDSSIHWDEETRIPTRLGDVQINLYLTRFVNQSIEPFYDGTFAWDQSMVKIREGLVASFDLNADEEKLLATYKEENMRFRKSDLIIPVKQIGNIWSAQGRDKYEHEMVIQYDCHQGLIIERSHPDGEGGKDEPIS